MPLQPCRDCGHEVSSEAVACPKCAAPIRPVKAASEGVFLKTLNCGCIVFFVVAGLIVFMMVLGG
jgi:hypothetical protein